LKRHSRSALRANASDESTAGRDLTAEHCFIALDSKIFQSALSTGVKRDYLNLSFDLEPAMIGRHSAVYFLPHRGSSNEKRCKMASSAPLSAAPHFEIAAFSNFGVSAG